MLVCLMAIASVNAETNVTIDGLRYSLSGAYASVREVAEGNTSEKIVVPATIMYEGLTYTVNEVGNNAFRYSKAYITNNKYVTEIVLPNTIIRIGENVFANSNITSVKLSEGIVRIGRKAFSGSSITSIIIPASVTDMLIGDGTFYDCNKLRTIIYLTQV